VQPGTGDDVLDATVRLKFYLVTLLDNWMESEDSIGIPVI
jgi:hypothetical protein